MRISTITLSMLALLIAGCTAPQTKYDAAMTIAVDQTDVLSQYPRAAQLLLPLGLKDSPDMGVTVTIQPLTDRDINPAYTFALDREDALTGNEQLRPAVVSAFVKKVQRCLDSLRPHTPMQHSEIFKSVVAQANNLAAVSVPRRYLVLLSDLNENAEISFYNEDTRYALVHSPVQVQTQLEEEARIGNLKGLELWLLYRPKSYQDNQPYRIASTFYQRIFSHYDARVHIDQNFDPQL